MPVKSANRTLLLFELFATEKRPLTISEISLAMDIPQSSTSVLVQSLLGLGYLEHKGDPRSYYPTFRIALLGTWMRRLHEGTGRLPRLVSKLAAETGQSAILAQRNGIFAQYIFAQIGPDPKSLNIESGLKRPLACSAVGWALLSLERDSTVGRIVRRTMAEAVEPQWRASAHEAAQKIADFRRDGYVLSEGQTTRGSGALAILLRPALDQSPIALGVGGELTAIKPKTEQILEKMRETAEEFSKIDLEPSMHAQTY